MLLLEERDTVEGRQTVSDLFDGYQSLNLTLNDGVRLTNEELQNSRRKKRSARSPPSAPLLSSLPLPKLRYKNAGKPRREKEETLGWVSERSLVVATLLVPVRLVAPLFAKSVGDGKKFLEALEIVNRRIMSQLYLRSLSKGSEGGGEEQTKRTELDRASRRRDRGLRLGCIAS